MKRFTETNKWIDPWFTDLSPTAKLLWLYLLDNCDNAGVIHFNSKLASVQIGESVEEKHLAELGDRLKTLPSGKLWVVKFIPFQYRSLSPGSNLHASAIELVKYHGLEIDLPQTSHNCQGGLNETSGRGIGTVKVQVKKGGVQRGENASIQEVFDAWNALSGFPECLQVSDKRRRSLQTRLKEEFFVAHWKEAMARLQASDFCRGVGGNGWKASFDWFITPEAVTKIMEGKYDNRPPGTKEFRL